MTRAWFWKLWCGVCCLFLAGGCASRLPRTLDVNGSELDRGQAILSRFLKKPCASAVDADVRLAWQAYGQQGKYPATLQAMVPSFLRLAVVDPLGRPVVLLVTDGRTFSLADNRHAEGSVGSMDADFIQKYLPSGIFSHDLFLWLSGRIPTRGLQVLSIRKAEQGALFWYEINYGDRMVHLVGLNRKYLVRHLILDEKKRIIADVRYSNYSDPAEIEQYAWPGKIEISGKNSAAVLSLEFTRIYGFSPLQKKNFHLQFPEYFTVRRVQ